MLNVLHRSHPLVKDVITTAPISATMSRLTMQQHCCVKMMEDNYSTARLIRMANARKNHANYPSMRIIRAYFTLSNITLRKVVSWTTMQIIRGVRISEGQIIQATL